jgi:hypothetical protein
MKPVTTSKTNEVAKITDVGPAVYKEYVSITVNPLNSAAENSDPFNSDSKFLVIRKADGVKCLAHY